MPRLYEQKMPRQNILETQKNFESLQKILQAPKNSPSLETVLKFPKVITDKKKFLKLKQLRARL